MTFAAPLKVTLRLVVWDVDEETGSRSIRDIKEQDVYMGDMPLMTDERHLHRQRHRARHRLARCTARRACSSTTTRARPTRSGKYLFAARVIPYRGSWLDFEFDAKDLVYVRIDRRRKLPVTTLLLRARRRRDREEARRSARPRARRSTPREALGMSPEEILDVLLRPGRLHARQGRLEDAVRSPSACAA